MSCFVWMDVPRGGQELPPSLRPEFLTMARTLGAVLRLIPLAGTTEEPTPENP